MKRVRNTLEEGEDKSAKSRRVWVEKGNASDLINELFDDIKKAEENYMTILQSVYRQEELEGGKRQLLKELLNNLDKLKFAGQNSQLVEFWRFLLGDLSFKEVYAGRYSSSIIPNKEATVELKRILHNGAKNMIDKKSLLADKVSREIVILNNGAIQRTNELITTIRQLCLSYHPSKRQRKEYMSLSSEAQINIAMDRRLAKLKGNKGKATIISGIKASEEAVALGLLNKKTYFLNKQLLEQNIRLAMGNDLQVSLKQVVSTFGITKGLPELLAYVNLLSSWKNYQVNTSKRDHIIFDEQEKRYLELPQIIYKK